MVLGMRAENNFPAPIGDDGAKDGVFNVVRDGYEAVYDVLPGSKTFSRLWRENAYNGEFPSEFAHIGFLTLAEAQQVLSLLDIGDDEVLVDVACGCGGPGLWMAHQTRASLVGIDPAIAGLRVARDRALHVGLRQRSRFEQGSFERTGLPDGFADAVVSVEALQYASNKRSAMTEFARVLRPQGRLALICFEVDPVKARGLPVLGVDPISDYKPLLADAGLHVETYVETPGWQRRVYGAFRAVADASDVLIQEMGAEAAGAAVAEAILTLESKPYPRRVLIGARRE
jgi:SAM-dependent methyltransferase